MKKKVVLPKDFGKLDWKPGKMWKLSNKLSKVSVITTVEKTIEVREGDRYVTLTFDSEWTTIDYKSNMPQKKSIDDWKFLIKALKLMMKELERNQIP